MIAILVGKISWLGALVLGLLVGATVARCPVGYYVAGVWATGWFACELARGDNDSAPIDRVRGIILCPKTGRPFHRESFVDARTVECTRW